MKIFLIFSFSPSVGSTYFSLCCVWLKRCPSPSVFSLPPPLLRSSAPLASTTSAPPLIYHSSRVFDSIIWSDGRTQSVLASVCQNDIFVYGLWCWWRELRRSSGKKLLLVDWSCQFIATCRYYSILYTVMWSYMRRSFSTIIIIF